MYWAEMPDADQVAALYATDYTESHGQLAIQEGNRAYYKTHVIEMRNELGRRRFSLLDYGSSYPVLAQEAMAKGVSAAAVDFSSDVLAWARERNIPAFAPQDDLPRCDVLRFSHVLEHLIDPRQVLCSLLLKLNPGGIVCITQPNFPVFKARFTGVALKDSVWPTHLHFFSPLSLFRLLDGFGLEIFRFDTHPPHDESDRAAFAEHIDLAIIEAELAGIKTRTLSSGDCRFPFYIGQNSGCWARHKAHSSALA